jgi:hypothetical protein
MGNSPMLTPPQSDVAGVVEQGLCAPDNYRMMVLSCPDCGREAVVERDDTDPPDAVRASLQCNRCDDGDRHSPEFFDGEGKWVDPVAHLAARQMILAASQRTTGDEG